MGVVKMANSERRNISLDDLRDRLAKAGVGREEDIDAFSALFTGLHIMASELGYCVSISADKEIKKLEDFDLTFKNLETNARYDLKKMMAVMLEVELIDENDK